MSVSVSEGLLDLFAPKFGMDGLGVPREKVTIRVLVTSKDRRKRMTLFGTYAIGGRHTQISSQRLSEFGSEVDVVSVERYSLKNFVEDANKALVNAPLRGKPEIKWQDGRVWLFVDGSRLPLTIRDMYVAAAKIFAVVESQGKRFRIALSDEMELFDMSRRRLVGMRMKGDRLRLERAFQNPEIVQASA